MSLLYLSGLEGIPGSIHLNDTKSHASVIQFTPIDHVETGKGNKIVEIPEGIDESIPCSSIVSISDSGNSSKDNDTDSGIAPAISNSLQTMKPAPNRDGGGSHLDSVDSIGFHHTTISPNINLGVSGNGGGQIEGVIRTGVLDYCPLVRRIRRRDRALRDLPILNVPAAKQHIKTGQPSRISIHGGIFSRLSTWMKAILVLKSVPEMILLEFVRLVKLSGDSEDGPSHGVPSAYYHGRLYDKEQLAAYVLATGTATIFGAIHCIAWSFQFPSDGEKVPWRLSSLAMTFFPIFGSVICRFESFFMRRGRVARSLYSFLFWTSIISYMSARLTLLVQMLLLLRAPDAGIYRAVRWTTFIPHF
ncbi:hypothetical protein FPV67DRAFT_919846 [Lyophyllum atratum]|nr:hypothetical protein FPV67DRAFT_919846 [Lyophyllum atratum]